MRTTKVQTQGHLLLVCESCAAPAVQRLVRRSRWFCIAGRAVALLGHSYVLHCTLCGAAEPLEDQQAERLRADVHAMAPVADDPALTPEALHHKGH